MWDYDDDNIDRIEHLYELRHVCNVMGEKHVSDKLKMSVERVLELYSSGVHGSVSLSQFVNISFDELKEKIKRFEHERAERKKKIDDVHEKNDKLISDLEIKRKQFADIGTNKAKRRLNKIAITSPLAKAVRLALEVEDKNIQAKKSYSTYQDKIYKQKTKLIFDLCDFFKSQGWIYGVQRSDVPFASHIVYFEIPNCEQISWHFTPEGKEFPKYTKEWDKKQNSTLGKLEVVAKGLLQKEITT